MEITLHLCKQIPSRFCRRRTFFGPFVLPVGAVAAAVADDDHFFEGKILVFVGALRLLELL